MQGLLPDAEEEIELLAMNTPLLDSIFETNVNGRDEYNDTDDDDDGRGRIYFLKCIYAYIIFTCKWNSI